ncbi:MAG: ABC transporter ATP-binding protein [Ardenticatenaceae bacterium]|nr:ABC transporter ATP-binding protein [Ardenticatenaceae bacterium]
MTEKSAITIKNLTKKFGDLYAVAGIDMEVPQGAFLVLLGPSGCGKTTALRMLAGLEEPSGGEIWLHDTLVSNGNVGIITAPGQRNAGMVFQSYALWPHMTINQNVEWPLKVQRWKASDRRARVREVLTFLNIEAFGDRYPGEISGGQQQRVAIARTIAPRPKFLLFDEPLSNLDAKLRAEMRTELLRVHRLTGATSVYVTHDQVEAMTMATHIAVMREGHIEQFGSPKTLLDQPATPFVANFIGTPPANLIRAEVQNGRFVFHDLDMGSSVGHEDKKSAWLMYRPDTLRLHKSAGSNCLPVEYVEATPVAGQVIVTVWHGDRRLNIITGELPDAQLGQELYLEFPAHPSKVYQDNNEQF